MSKAGSFLGGLGMGAAAGYAQKKKQETSNAPVAAGTPGQTPPQVKPSMLEVGIDKLKGFLAPGNAGAAVAAGTTAPVAGTPAPAGDEFTAGFSDDTAVPSEPVPFQNIYNQQARP